MRRGFGLVELAIALALAAVLFYGGLTGLRAFSRPAGRADLTMDRMKELQIAVETIERDVREARRILYPRPGAAPSPVMVFRSFDGHITSYHHRADRRQVGRAVLAPAEASGAERTVARGIDVACFTVSPEGLVSWAVFSRDTALLGSARRQNQ